MKQPAITAELQFTGRLIEPAVAAMRPLDHDGHMVPALCFVVELESLTRGRCRVEQLFPVADMAQCKAAAERMAAGTRVTFTAPIVGIELQARNATHVHVLNAPQSTNPTTEEATA